MLTKPFEFIMNEQQLLRFNNSSKNFADIIIKFFQDLHGA